MPSPTEAPVEHVHVAEEVGHKRRGRMVEYLLGSSDLFDDSVVEDDDLIRQFERLFLVVSDEDSCQADFVVEPSQPGSQFLSHFCIERLKGFVQQ